MHHVPSLANAPIPTDQFIWDDAKLTGIGRSLLALMQEQLGPRCKLLLLAAPAANSYHEHIGFTYSPRCWILQREHSVRS
jgi:hypothetical protein